MGTIYDVDYITGNITTTGSITAAGGITSTSITKGFLLPQLTTTQRNAVVGNFATGTATVVDYTMLAGAVLTIHGHALTEGVDWFAATSNTNTAVSLAGAITTATA